MFRNIASSKKFLSRLVGYCEFLRQECVVSARDVIFVFALSTVTVLAETLGLTMLIPILSYVEKNGDIVAFANSSFINRLTTEAYDWAGIPISLISLSIAALTSVIIRQALNYANTVELDRLKWNLGHRFSEMYFKTLLSSTAMNILTSKPGHFVKAADHECQITATIIRHFGTLWMQTITLIAYGGVLFITAPIASLVACSAILLVMLCLGSIMRITGRLSNNCLDYRKEYSEFLLERFRAWKLIKLSNTLNYECAKVDEIQRNIVKNQVGLTQIGGAFALIFVPIMSAFLLSTLYVFVEVLHLNVAIIIGFSLILLRLMPVSQAIQKGVNGLVQHMPSYEFIRTELSRARANMEEVDTGRPLQNISRDIEFTNVTYSYPDREHVALENVSVTIPAGTLTAIIGPSGAGKSTLVDMIPRLIVPEAGEILIDGTPSCEFSLRSLRSQVAYVTQDPYLFDATVVENLRYVRPEATQEEIDHAVKLANADEFIDALPQKFDTPLGTAGAFLSGGQKQRLVLARAFLSNASVLVLDEPTSALDYKTEELIKSAIEHLQKIRKLTVIVIAHRLSTIQNADLVIHLQDGKILETGLARDVMGKTNDTDAPLSMTPPHDST